MSDASPSIGQPSVQPYASELQVAPEMPDYPAVSPNVQLVGELQGAGFRDRQWLIQRDSRFIQVTELLYRVAEHADGEHTLEEIAERVTETTDWQVSGEQVGYLLQTKLIPLGIVVAAGGTDSPRAVSESPRSPLQLKMRIKMLGPEIIEPFTRVLQYLFAPMILLPALLGIAAAHAWLYFDHGIARAIDDVIYTPGALSLVTAIVLLSAVVHEFGHAAALRYGGGRVRGMGAGVYLIFPALYTDTTDSYRLGRWARVRTDLGGFYFHLILTVGIMGMSVLTGQEYLLVAVLMINFDIVRQCLPFVRFDGYWALADLTGIPDFFSQMAAFIRSVVPISIWQGAKLPPLKPWVRAVFAIYILVGIPVLAFLLFRLVTHVPRIVERVWDALGEHWETLSDALRLPDVAGALAAASQILLLVLPLVFLTYFLASLAWRLVRAAWRQPTLPRRLAGGVIVTAVFGLVASAWLL